MRTITTAGPHGIGPGHLISISVPDRRWWRRLLFWLLRRGRPMRTVTRRVATVTQKTLTLED